MNHVVYKTLGFMFVGLAALGVFLPLLPTTPLLLVAAACFAKSSDKWHQWLLSNKIFGPIIQNWQKNRCISFGTKLVAILMIVSVGGYSILFAVTDSHLKIIGGLLIAAGLFFVCRLKVCPKASDPEPMSKI